MDAADTGTVLDLADLLTELGPPWAPTPPSATPKPALVVGEESLADPADAVGAWLNQAGPALRANLPAGALAGGAREAQ